MLPSNNNPSGIHNNKMALLEFFQDMINEWHVLLLLHLCYCCDNNSNWNYPSVFFIGRLISNRWQRSQTDFSLKTVVIESSLDILKIRPRAAPFQVIARCWVLSNFILLIESENIRICFFNNQSIHNRSNNKTQSVNEL